MGKAIPKQFVILLSQEQRERLEIITRNGHASAKKIRHAQVLLWSDGNREGGRLSSREIGERLSMHVNSVDRIRKRFVLEGEEPALNRKTRETPAIPRKIDGHAEAHLIAICCGPAPEGRSRWTLKLLAHEMTRRGLVTQVCAETVRTTLKKMSCSLGESSAGVFPNEITLGSSRKWKASSISMRRNIATRSQ